MKSIKELEAEYKSKGRRNFPIDDFGYLQALKDVIKLIDECYGKDDDVCRTLKARIEGK